MFNSDNTPDSLNIGNDSPYNLGSDRGPNGLGPVDSGLGGGGRVEVYGISVDIFDIFGIGFDFGIYHDSHIGSFGFYGGFEKGIGVDLGISFETGYADSVEALNGSYTVTEIGIGGVSINVSFGPNGDSVTVGNIGVDNGGVPCGHTGTGNAGTIDF